LELPQTTTEPSVFNAAKAPKLEDIEDTPPLKDDDTDEESPPLSELPQVTTEPSGFNAAKAPLLE
tara:strand:- start:78 stop:272 length:195 start_codon:yes stop_codon:yes gene_type:complete